MPINKLTKTVKCPECNSLSEWSKKNIYRPFCSKRCQLLDLGAWTNEMHKIPGDSLNESILDDPEKA
ncbi:MAG: DNA gyrase inhibitor YacG [SAR86 cluster bacterium]|nr:DNA gyrase inhibitor YacG [SAR86 cluster bacterium]